MPLFKYLFLIFILAVLSHAVLSKLEAIDDIINRLDYKRSSASVQESAAKAVLQRLLPTHNSSFDFKIVGKDVCGGPSCFLIENYKRSCQNEPEITIKGTTAVEIASGLHWYIKYWCGAHVSWDKTGGVQIASVPKPGSLPLVKDECVRIQRPVPWNYYQNVVTYSYSFVWWDWERWEKEIDWMALQGINLPLAFTGQEAIWQKVYAKYNVSKEDLEDFFAGPAFLAWARMGNLHGWGGHLSQNWLNQQLDLQKKILSRMLELGMTPVLPSFSGHVPSSLKMIFPSANITRLGDWNTIDGNPRFCCTYLLEPTDPLFLEVGEAFIRQQIAEYGDVTDIYNCDTFNENTPPTNDPTYISSLGAAVYKAMSKGDKDAVWLMQGWLFSSEADFWKPPQMKALLHSVPLGKMIVLDLFAEVKPIWKTSSHFYGTPYVWCMLHNFGGNIEMYGILDSIASGPVDARLSKTSTMVGVGMCMEGIEQNPVVYELMSEMAFHNQKVQVSEWIKTYAHRRYGKVINQVEAAWNILYHTVYNCTDGITDHNTDFIVKFPDWDPSLDSGSAIPKEDQVHPLHTLPGTRRFLVEENSKMPQAHLWYSTQEFIKGLKLFLDAGNDLAGSTTYRYDLVDMTRQALSKLANQVFIDAVIAFQKKDAQTVTLHTEKFVQLIKDIDALLGSNGNFLLGTWVESAKKLGVDAHEKLLYQGNAKAQVTMWFNANATTQSKLHDYANKFWSGLLVDYYLPRASTYFDFMAKSLREKDAFQLQRWREEWLYIDNFWPFNSKIYPVKATGDSLDIAKALYDKYLSQ